MKLEGIPALILLWALATAFVWALDAWQTRKEVKQAAQKGGEA